jgi:hypothetical protein
MTTRVITVVCGWCRRVRVGASWRALVAVGLVSHGACPDCAATFRTSSRRGAA